MAMLRLFGPVLFFEKERKTINVQINTAYLSYMGRFLRLIWPHLASKSRTILSRPISPVAYTLILLSRVTIIIHTVVDALAPFVLDVRWRIWIGSTVQCCPGRQIFV